MPVTDAATIELADRHIADALRRIDEQRILIDRLDERGIGAVQADKFLGIMLEILEQMRRHRATMRPE